MSEVKSWYEDAASKLRESAELVEKIGVERDKFKAELDMFRRCYQEAIDSVDAVFQLTSEQEPILPEFLLPGDNKFHGVKKLAFAYRETKAELAKLQAERETRDNGDGTVTALLPVTYPQGLDVVEVRSRRAGDTYTGVCGVISVAEGCDDRRYNVFLIIRQAPKPPEPVTWEAPLSDGEWSADDEGFRNNKGHRWLWLVTGQAIRGLAPPEKFGKYEFAKGVGTLIEAAQ